jgi:hypothetical protein
MSTSVIPAHNPSIWPSALPGAGMPPGAPGLTQGIDFSYHGPPAGMPTADLNADGRITKGYVLNPHVGEFTHTLIREGHPLFFARGTPGLRLDKQDILDMGESDERPHTIFSLSMMNRTLSTCWNQGLTALMAHKDRVRGIFDAQTNNMLKYLDLPENSWNELYANDSALIRDHPVWRHYFYLSQQGICTRWNPYGFSVYSSSPVPQDRGGMPYMPLTVMSKGVCKYIANVWGPAVGQGTKLYFILKRVKLDDGHLDPFTGQAYGAFAFHPYSTCKAYVPQQEREYVNLSGSIEYGKVFPVGIVRDCNRTSLPPYDLAIAQGISPDYSAELEREISKNLPVLDVAVHQRMGYGVSVC